MKYVDEFRSRKLIDKVADQIRKSVDENRTYNIMEVCGTHTMSIFRYGLKDILPGNIKLISGPGCPVCVTPNSFLDKAICLSKLKDVTITTFGDMLKVPGSYSSLEKEKATGASIKTVYSTMDAIDLAKKNKKKNVVFLGIGFETTRVRCHAMSYRARGPNGMVVTSRTKCARKVQPSRCGPYGHGALWFV